ncbi:hypothetical protein P170DRAFT_199296 [Aspergillus steynii IBT 23096]|uniref:Uncharacterized protein n=1 Tax=Aspergillus steynii IBT 23096 TaxID=1392250 RepID=A0A2I2G4U1_9EURO|nr:uncharacterized protein P170DRAFT_199296 [Aspergillus steynii IBT 23096]PLB47887.1 hypothetical protein P170DRAFT_199296 [Aspergillus steynii IBT 23096]
MLLKTYIQVCFWNATNMARVDSFGQSEKIDRRFQKRKKKKKKGKNKSRSNLEILIPIFTHNIISLEKRRAKVTFFLTWLPFCLVFYLPQSTPILFVEDRYFELFCFPYYLSFGLAIYSCSKSIICTVDYHYLRLRLGLHVGIAISLLSYGLKQPGPFTAL